MFYSFGEQYSYNLLFTVAKRYFTRPVDELELGDFQGAYQRWVAAQQPAQPAARVLGVDVVDDAQREEQLIRPLLQPSALDDNENYKHLDRWNTVHQDRSQVAREAAHVTARLDEFRAKDPSFWEVFSIYANHIVCTNSKLTPGGTSSAALGVIYLSRPDERTPDTLYELLVHECTHLMMFVDERRARHYRSLEAIAKPENFSISAVYEKLRPLDKTLHSIVVATEVMLHRERVLGHATDSTVHPPTSKLAPSTLRACDALLDLQARRQLLGPRGVQIVETCASLVRGLGDTQIAIAV